jgi:secreted protein with Ig-like and vWFA domain
MNRNNGNDRTTPSGDGPSSIQSERNRRIDALISTIRPCTWLMISICFILAICAGIFFSTRKTEHIATDFLQKVPEERAARLTYYPTCKSSTPPRIPAPAFAEKKKLTPSRSQQGSGGTTGGGGDPRSRVTGKGVLGIINGQTKGKNVTSADVFGKGGFANDIDATLSGVGGLKSGGSGGAGRKGAAGIGYGSGYGGAGIDDLIGGLTGRDGSGSLNLKKRGSLKIQRPQFCRGAAMYSLQYCNTESYDFINENDFRTVMENPLSTFSIDVDVASYSNVRRFIENGSLPPPDAVRIEELINYFTYNYREPRGSDPFSLSVEMAQCPWNGDHRLALVGVQGKQVETSRVPPSNLVFLIDVSGSMQDYNKLPLVKKSLNLLVNNLREQDRIAITVYAGSAGLVLPSTSGHNKRKIRACINRLAAGGSTAGAQGIQLAYATAQKQFIRGGNNRVILATDGDFNVGVSSDAELVRLIEQKRDRGIYLTVLGFGTGNYKDSKMEKLADKGNGNYAYIDRLAEAEKVLVKEMSGTLLTIAKDVKIQIEFNPRQVHAYRLIGYENRIMKKEEFNDDRKDAGELGAGHSVTALYEIITAENMRIPAVDPLRYQQETVEPEPEPVQKKYSDEIMLVKLRYKKPDQSKSRLIKVAVKESDVRDHLSENLSFASSIAGFGMLLRNSEHKGRVTWEQVASLAREGKGKDRSGYRKEFISMVDKCKSMVQ